MCLDFILFLKAYVSQSVLSNTTIVKNGFELLTLLSSLPECWDCSLEPPI